jgi:dinuclear metal center YbgI/SA1388 family protein
LSIACQVLISAIEKVAPRHLAEEWDNVGLLIGEPGREIRRVLFTLDCTPEVVQEAVTSQVDLIVAHHPLLFKPIKQIRYDRPGQSDIATLIRNNIMFYAAHTNLDSCPIGGNATLAENLALTEQEFLQPGYREQIFKVVVFVPEASVVQVRESMSKAGAGALGNYNECFFETQGTGCFRPLEGANPFIGKIGTLESVAEIRLESIVTAKNLDRVIRAMLKAHPYEVPAYDIIPTKNPGAEYGIGIVGKLKAEIRLKELALKIKAQLGGGNLRVVGDLDKQIKKVALCTGSGGSLVKNAAFKGAGVLIAGDISHHEALDAQAAGMAIIDPGHYATEWFMVEKLQQYLIEEMNKDKRKVELVLSTIKTEPFKFM